MDATASSVAASTGRGRGAAAAGALGVAAGAAGVAAICTRAVASWLPRRKGLSGSPLLFQEYEGVTARSFAG